MLFYIVSYIIVFDTLLELINQFYNWIYFIHSVEKILRTLTYTTTGLIVYCIYLEEKTVNVTPQFINYVKEKESERDNTYFMCALIIIFS